MENVYKSKIENPILRGFNPDPNILRVGDTYYIAVSSFEWLPGVRIYTSKDLVNWQHETDLLTDQVNMRGNPRGGSIWAPQISFCDGMFYLIYTDLKSVKRPFKDSHNFLISAPSIHGKWSDPVYINSSGFDPSLFHDSDGRKWFLNQLWDYRMATPNKSCGIVMQEFDPKTQKLVGEVYKIFDGTHLAKTEAPHIYKHGEYYYLVTAEGGTGKDHSVTICRSKNVTGPYELDPKFPMLTASDKPNSPLQCSGHASLVESDYGWYMAYLCTRPLGEGNAILGRETAIQEVVWTDDGWLRLANGTNRPDQFTEIKTKQPVTQVKDTNFRDDFDTTLDKEWNTLRIQNNWCDLSSRKGWLRLVSGESPQSLSENHLLAIRQKDFNFTAETKMEYTPTNFMQMAGLMLFLHDGCYLYAYLTYDEEKGRVLRVLLCENDEFVLRDTVVQVDSETVWLKFTAKAESGQFYYSTDGNHWQPLGEEENLLFLSGGFTGNYVGITVNDTSVQFGSYADFDYFSYEGNDELGVN